MAVPIVTWRRGGTRTFTQTGTNSDLVKQFINEAHTLLLNDSPQYVSISDHSATEAHLEISLSGLSGFDTDFRGLLFGGQTPNAGALNNSLSGSFYGYVLASPSAGTTGPDQSYTAGDPYTSDPSNTGGVVSFYPAGATAIDTVTYWECEEAVVFLWSDASAHSVYFCALGAIVESVSGNREYGLIASGSTTTNPTWANNSADNGNMISIETAPASGDSRVLVYSSEKAAVGRCYRTQRLANTQNMQNAAGTSVGFLGIPLLSNDLSMQIGVLRQMYIGNKCRVGDTSAMPGGGTAFGLSYSNTTLGDALWLGNE